MGFTFQGSSEGAVVGLSGCFKGYGDNFSETAGLLRSVVSWLMDSGRDTHKGAPAGMGITTVLLDEGW